MIKHPALTDIDQVFQFMLACDIEEYGEGDSSREDLEEQWSEIDLSRDAWVAYDDRDTLTGYACVSRHGARYGLDIYIHAKLTPINLEDELADLCLNRVNDQMITNQNEKAVITGYATAANPRLQQVFELHGFERHTYHYRMQFDFDQPVETIDWPMNLTLSTYENKDEAELFQLINDSFTWKGREIPTLESWRSLIFRGGRF